MYERIVSNVFLSRMPQYDVNLMNNKVVELDEAYFIVEDNF